VAAWNCPHAQCTAGSSHGPPGCTRPGVRSAFHRRALHTDLWSRALIYRSRLGVRSAFLHHAQCRASFRAASAWCTPDARSGVRRHVSRSASFACLAPSSGSHPGAGRASSASLRSSLYCARRPRRLPADTARAARNREPFADSRPITPNSPAMQCPNGAELPRVPWSF